MLLKLTVDVCLKGVCQMLLGEFDYESIEDVNPDMAALFFVTYMFLVMIVLLNILLAILIEGYDNATKDQEGTSILVEIGRGIVRGWNALRGLTKEINDEKIVEALQRLNAQSIHRVTAQDIGTILSQQHLKGTGAVDPVHVVAKHQLLKRTKVTDVQQAHEDLRDTSGFPEDLIESVEMVLRENDYLSRRTD